MAKTAMLPFSSSAWLVTPRTTGLLPDNMQVCKELTNEMCQKTPALRAIYLLNNWLSMSQWDSKFYKWGYKFLCL